MQKNNDAMYKQGDLVYISQEGMEYILNCHPEMLGAAQTGMIYIQDVSEDENDTQETLYTGYFIDDADKEEIQLYHFETIKNPTLIPLHTTITSPVETLDILTTPMPVDIMDSYFEHKGQELGALVDRKQKAYGNAVQQTHDVVKVFMKPYQNTDGSYTIPESLLMHLLLQVRIIDKQNRIFNNPDGDLMSESPYGDLGGYSLLGQALSAKSEFWN